METIHCRMSIDQLNIYGTKLGLSVKPDLDAKRYDHVCSWLISYNVIGELEQMADLTLHTYSEVIESFSLMTRWVNLAKIARCLRVALDMWHNPQAGIIFDNAYLSSKMDDYPTRIHEDLCTVAAWITYRGADGASIRRVLPSKIQNDIRKIIQKVGDDGIISMFWRSIIAFISMSEKAIEPIYKESFRHGVKESCCINSFGDALKAIKHVA